MFVFFYIYRELMHSLHVTGMVCKSDDIIHIHQYSANDKKKTEIINDEENMESYNIGIFAACLIRYHRLHILLTRQS